MDSKQLRKCWRRALKSNVAEAMALLRRRGPLNAKAVHDFRVSLRRARLLLQLRSKDRDRNHTKRFRAAARKIMDAFAPVRDTDVVLEGVRSLPASSGLLARILSGRTVLCHRAERKLARLKPKIRAARASSLLKIDRDKLARRYHRWQTALADHCQTDASRAVELSTSELHQLRRDLRHWRYLRELLMSRQQAAQDDTIRILVAAQEALGAVQDTEVVLTALQRQGRSREVTTLKAELRARLRVRRQVALEKLKQIPGLPASV